MALRMRLIRGGAHKAAIRFRPPAYKGGIKIWPASAKEGQLLCPLAGLLGPMALRPRAHAGVPPLPLALRGGSLLY